MTGRKLLFVGSGLSIAMGMPSWQTLLKEVAMDLPQPEQSIMLGIIDQPDHEYEAADRLAGIVGKSELQNRLAERIRFYQKTVVSPRKLVDWSERIGGFGFSGIVTTNWDTLLTQVVPTDTRILVWDKDCEELIEALRDNQPFVLYLHGNVDCQSLGIPLAVTSEDCIDQAKTFQARFHLDDMFAIFYLIVIGYGFSDPHISKILEASSLLAGQAKCIRIIVLPKHESKPFCDAYRFLSETSQIVTFDDYVEFGETFCV